MKMLANLKALRETTSNATREATAGVDKTRSRRLELLAEQEGLERMIMPLDLVEAGLDHSIDRLVAEARRNLYTPSLTHSPTPALAPLRPETLIGLLIGANREEFRAIVVDEFSEKYEGVEVLDLPARKARLTEIADELDQLERLEEAMIREAEMAGVEILRRPDPDPDVLLLADESLGL